MGLKVVTVHIPRGKSLSNGADCTDGTIVRLAAPLDEWDGATIINFEVSTDDTPNYHVLLNSEAELIQVPGQGWLQHIDPRHRGAGSELVQSSIGHAGKSGRAERRSRLFVRAADDRSRACGDQKIKAAPKRLIFAIRFTEQLKTTSEVFLMAPRLCLIIPMDEIHGGGGGWPARPDHGLPPFPSHPIAPGGGGGGGGWPAYPDQGLPPFPAHPISRTGEAWWRRRRRRASLAPDLQSAVS